MDFHLNITEDDNNLIPNNCACRCCLTKSTELKPLFNSTGSGSLCQAIFLFTAVKIEQNDKLPSTICTTCIDHLNKCILFKQKVESTDCLLRKLLNKSSQLQDVQELSVCSGDHDYAKPIYNSLQNKDTSNTIGLDVKCKSSSNSLAKKPQRKEDYFCCIECGKKFKDKTTLDIHEICHNKKSITALRPKKSIFSCPVCKDNFSNENDLFVHSSLHDKSNGFVCKSCNKNFLNYFKLKRHIPSHFQEKPFKCKECKMRFVEMASLTRHFRVHTGTRPKSSHMCLICKKTFPNRYSLKVHHLAHSGERPWKCEGCDKQFHDFRLLNSHKRVHDDKKPYECKNCKKSFRHRSTLITHMQIHMSNNRPHRWRCEKCKKSFKQSRRLHLHKQRVHSTIDSLRFLCEQCSQTFTSTASLEDHLRWHGKNVEVHNDDTPKEAPPEFFQCNDCSAQFSFRLDLITHQKLTHALRHECDTCFGKWKTLEELVRHKCNEASKTSNEPSPDEMILLPNGQMQDCYTIVDTLLASVSQLPATPASNKESTKTA